MVLVEVISTGQFLEILDDNVTYNKQVADFGDITSSVASHSWNMRVARTPRNAQILENLGIVGDTSTIPYRKIYCRLYDDGSIIVDKGLLAVKETNDEYRVVVQEGIIDFYKDLSDKTIGQTINLSELSHENSLANIVDSWENLLPYKYVLADFNGPPLANVSGRTNLNPVALVPSVRIKWLWDKIFEHYQWSYSGKFNFEEFETKWLSYPSALSFDDSVNELAMFAQWKRGRGDRPLESDFVVTNDSRRFMNGKGWQAPFEVLGTFINEEYGELFESGRYYLNKITGIYKISWRLTGKKNLSTSHAGDKFRHEYQSFIAVNETVHYETASNSFSQDEASITIALREGDLISVVGFDAAWRTTVDETSFIRIEETGTQEVDFNEALIKYKMKDFIKEMMIRSGITAFPDVQNKHIYFDTLNQRLDADAIDWSAKYVRRVSEKYTYSSYAQNNYLKHKYDKESKNYADGNLRVKNENLDISKTIYQSETFANEEDYVEWNTTGGGAYLVPSFKLYDIQIKKDAAGNIIGDYKPLKERFFIFGEENSSKTVSILGNTYTNFPLALVKGNIFSDIDGEVYGRISELLNDTRIHEIELALSKYDVATLDLRQRYYFEQQASYYILNKLAWKNSSLCVGEFIRVKN